MATRGKLPSFFKIVPGHRFTNKLKIPTEFLQHFHGNVPQQCQLQTAAQTWLVHVEVVNNKFYFQEGWNAFLQQNGLKYGQLLVFHYAGNSHFHVDIFGKNTRGELFVMAETEVADEEDYDVSLEISDGSPVSSPLPRKKYKTSSSVKERGGTSSSQRFIEKDLWGAHIRAEEFKLENPSAFLVSMKPSYIKYKFVWLPAEFTMLVKPRIENSGDVILWVSDWSVRTWRAKLTCDNVSTNRCKLHGSCWSEFMRDNNLKEGDLCAFMLIKDIRVIINVVIFHTKEAANRTLSPDISDNEDHENDEEGDDESEDEEETEDEEEGDDASSEALNCVPPGSRTIASRLHKRRKNWKNWTSSIVKAPCLSRDEKILNAIALKKANAFQSESTHHSFVVSLCASYAGGSYLSFPRTFAERHIINGHPNYVILRVNRSFLVNSKKKRSFLVRVNYIERTTRLQAGWSEFAHANNLKMGDVCVFVLTNAKKFEFEVEIFRVTDAVCTSSQGKGKQLRTESINSRIKTEIQID